MRWMELECLPSKWPYISDKCREYMEHTIYIKAGVYGNLVGKYTSPIDPYWV